MDVQASAPLTREALGELLAQRGVPPERYSLWGDHGAERWVIDNRPAGWVVFYAEHGSEQESLRFDTEDEACHALLSRLTKQAR
jgi:hypothetical protein